MSGNKQLKKDGQRKEKKTEARKRDFDQRVVGADSPQQAKDASSFSDDAAGRAKEEAE
jgi:hypothetical protein